MGKTNFIGSLPRRLVDAATGKSVNITSEGAMQTEIITNGEGKVSVQNPFQIDGDSVYSKDIDTDSSSLGGFTGKTIKQLFNNYHTEMVDASVTNPKTFTMHFERPIKSAMVAMGSLTGDFSNVKIFLKDEQGNVVNPVDDSANNTKFNSNGYSFPPTTFIEVVVEFHTVDEVRINGLFISKYKDVIALIQGVDDQTGEVVFAKFDNGEFIVGGSIKSKDSNNQIIDPSIKQYQRTVADFEVNDTEELGEPSFIAYGGKESQEGVWLIVKTDESGDPFARYANVSNNGSITSYSDAWTNRATLTYTTFGGLTW